MCEKYDFLCPHCGSSELNHRVRVDVTLEDVGIELADNGQLDAGLSYYDQTEHWSTMESISLSCNYCDHEWDSLDSVIADGAIVNNEEQPVDAAGEIKPKP